MLAFFARKGLYNGECIEACNVTNCSRANPTNGEHTSFSVQVDLDYCVVAAADICDVIIVEVLDDGIIVDDVSDFWIFVSGS